MVRTCRRISVGSERVVCKRSEVERPLSKATFPVIQSGADALHA